MADVIIMPKLGLSMDEGQIITWCKKEGASIRKGEILFEMNTDKSTMSVEATRDGVVLKILLAEGETAPVFTPIAVIGEAGENPDEALKAAGQTPDAAASAADAPLAAAAEAPAPQAAAAPDLSALRLTPKARRLAAELRLDPASLGAVAGTGYAGGITAKDILAAFPKVKASPLARKVAEQGGVSLTAVAGTGAGGKIMKADVERALAAPAPAAAVPANEAMRVLKTMPYTGVRKLIGERLAASKFTAPHLYFMSSVDTANLMELRRQINTAGPCKVAVSDLLIKAVSKALQAVPELNSALHGEQILCYESVNIGIAVGVGSNGLVVPVVRDTQAKSLSDIALESRDLVERAKSGKLLPDEYTGGTFTISNLGMFGIEQFTAILNPPEAGILAVGAICKKPVVVSAADGTDSVAIRPIMNIQLSVDHRIIDGMLAARFMGRLKELLEQPVTMLV